MSKTDLTRPKTWVPYKKGLCNDCQAMCCRLPVEVTGDDLERMGLIGEFEKELGAVWILKEFRKQGLVKSYSAKNLKFTLEQRPNGECIFLDKEKRCTVYDKRPTTCREHPRVGPRPGYCAYTAKISL